jgi:hypothetical protein
MSKVIFTGLQHSIEDLSYVQLKRLHHPIESKLSKDEVGQVLAKHENEILNSLIALTLRYLAGEVLVKAINVIAVIVVTKHSALSLEQVYLE